MRLTRRALIAAGLALPGLAIARSVPARLATPAGRAIDVSSWRAARRRRGVILFSHGALSAPRYYLRMIEPWVTAGYDVHAPLHTDSLLHPDRAAFAGLAGWASRIEDMRALSASLDEPFIAAGHSYGALTALVLGGVRAAVPDGLAGPLRDPRAVRCVAFSPPGPLPPLISEAGYAGLAVPALIQTGTRDILPSRADDPDSWRAHLTAYDQAPPGGARVACVIDGADHYFGGLICDFGKTGPDQAAQLSAAVDASLAFMMPNGGRPSTRRGQPLLKSRPGLTFMEK